MRRYFAALILMLVALPAAAQPPYYARGTFGDPANDPNPDPNLRTPWNDLTHQMVDQGGGHYTATVGDVNTYFPGFGLDYKLANSDYSTQAPSSDNGHVVTDNNGEVNFHFWANNGNPWTDGWYPNNGPRAGYEDPLQFGWEINGTFNNWTPTADPSYLLTTSGNGLYTGTFTMPAGSYQFKFRQQGSYATSIGADFSNSAANNSFRVWDNGEQWTFNLDLPNGRWQATSNTPTPDLNTDEYVDAGDYVLWRKSNGAAPQYAQIRKHFGAVPPPPSFFARGSWSNPVFDQSTPMASAGGSEYVATVSGLTPGTPYSFKLANADYSKQSPTSDGRVAADANGDIHFHLYDQTTWTDGWFPNNQRRAGYDDPHQYTWELMGTFNGFAGGPQYVMSEQGAGVYRVITALAAGSYEFKFRKYDTATSSGDWGISIGRDFGNSAANATTGAITAGNYAFELDLPNGRWRFIAVSGSGSSLASSAVPEPATLAIAMLGLALMGFVRRR